MKSQRFVIAVTGTFLALVPIVCFAQAGVVPQVDGTVAEREALAGQLTQQLTHLPDDGRKPAYLMKIGDVCYSLGKHQEAITHYDAALKLLPRDSPSRAQLKILIGQSYEILGRVDSASKVFNSSLGETSLYGDIAAQRSVSIVKEGSPTETNNIVAQFIRLPDEKLTYSKIGAFRQILESVAASGGKTRAKGFYRAWLDKHTKHWAAPVIALDLYRLDHAIGSEKAVDLETICLQYDCNNGAGVNVLYEAAVAHEREENSPASAKTGQRALAIARRLGKEEPFFEEDLRLTLSKHLAYSLYLSGKKDAARAIRDQLVREHPKSSQSQMLDQWLNNQSAVAPVVERGNRVLPLALASLFSTALLVAFVFYRRRRMS